MREQKRRHVTLQGGDYAVLALHGLRSTPLELQPVLKSLHTEGFTVEAPHLTGFGFSTDPLCGSWTDWLQEALDRFDALKAKYSHVAVCGLSMGTTLALAVAAERGAQVAAVGALSTTLYYDGWNTPWYRFLRPLGYFTPLRHRMVVREIAPYGVKNLRLREWIARQVAASPVSAVGASSLSLSALHEAEKLMRHTRAQLHRIVAPTLILHSSEDDVASMKSAYHVQRQVQSSDVRLVQLHDSYHMITLDNERDHVAALTRDFFKHHGGRTALAAPIDEKLQHAAV
jgi:carboxylesterase